MDFRLVLSLFIFACSLNGIVLAQDESESELGLRFPNWLNFSSSSNRTIKFYLYTRETIMTPDIYKHFIRRNFLPSFKKNKPLKVVIHGWKGSDEKTFCSKFREGLLKNEDVNVITVDWSENGSKNWLYPVSRNRVPEVGAIVAEFLDNLHHTYGVRLEDVHVIGHSLGAHIAGLAGKKVKTGKIGRITGLDPAGPSFSVEKSDERLTQDSAIFVDVIHTCGIFLGMSEPIGHADFYPNSGKFIQPGCGVDVIGACSHRRSYFLYIESLGNKKAFPAVACPSWNDYKKDKESCDIKHVVYMGEGLSTSARGVYYLKTNKESPFGLGQV